MPRIIVKSGYIKSSKHREYYMKYIATRDGVEFVDSSNGDMPTTKKQKELIEQLLQDYPESTKLFEYEDYTANPTRKMASELISVIMDHNLHTIMKKENYVGYIANRPRVEKLGMHGLFSNTDNTIDLKQVTKEVRDHKGNVWIHIISLKREDAKRLGYDNAENWKNLCKMKMNELAEAMRIDPTNLQYYAAFHNEGHHPHIHMIVYSKDEKEGYLTRKGIEKIRSIYAKEIFHHDLMQIYSKQTQARDNIKQFSKEIVSEMFVRIQERSIETNEDVFVKMKALENILKDYHGRLVYGYLPKAAKLLLDEIMRELEKDERLQVLYEQWRIYRNDILHTYSDKYTDALPLSEQKEFKSIKNMLLSEIMKSRTDDYSELRDNDLLDVEDHEKENLDDGYFVEDALPSMECSADRYQMKWSKQFKEAAHLFYESVREEQDLVNVKMLLEKECLNHNILAYELLGKLYEIEDDEGASMENYQTALEGSLFILNTDHSKFAQDYLNYKVGKFYFYGLGVAQDHEKARDYLENSDSEYASYTLGMMYQRGLGVERSEKTAFSYFHESADKGNAFAQYQLGVCYEEGKVVDKNIDIAKDYYQNAFRKFESMLLQKKDDHLLYRLGSMLYYGKGVEKDIDSAKEYLEDAVKSKNENAKFLLAKLYLETDEYSKIPDAIKWLEESQNDTADFILGKEYMNGIHVEQDIEKAIQYFEKCLEKNNPYAAFKLGKIYLENRDVMKGIRYMDICAKQGNDIAQYILGMIYLKDEQIEKNVDKAIDYLARSAKQNNRFAQYALGKLFLFGKEVKRDEEKALYFLSCSSIQGNEYAQYLLDHMKDYLNQGYALCISRFFHHVSQIFQQQLPNDQGNYHGVDRKLAQKIKLKKIAQGHNKQDRNISIR